MFDTNVMYLDKNTMPKEKIKISQYDIFNVWFVHKIWLNHIDELGDPHRNNVNNITKSGVHITNTMSEKSIFRKSDLVLVVV